MSFNLTPSAEDDNVMCPKAPQPVTAKGNAVMLFTNSCQSFLGFFLDITH